MQKRNLTPADLWIDSQRRSLSTRLFFWCRRWRSALIRIVEKILIGNGLSNRVIQDISSLSRMQSAMSDVEKIELLEDAKLLPRKFSGDAGIFPEFSDFRRAIFRYEFRNAVVHIESGVANVCGGFLVEELFGHYIAIFGRGTVAHEFRATTQRVRYMQGKWVVAAVPNFYFHFVVQTLPSIIRSLAISDCQGVVVSGKRMPIWALEALEALGSKVVLVDDKAVRFESYICCSEPQITSESDVEVLRAAYQQYISQSSVGIAFIGRYDLHRNLGLIENQIASVIESNGGSVLDPSKLNWGEEIRFYSSFSKFVIVSGSAMANLTWMQPGTKVLLLIEGERFTTQIEKSLILATGVEVTEFLVDRHESLSGELLSVVNSFLRT